MDKSEPKICALTYNIITLKERRTCDNVVLCTATNNNFHKKMNPSIRFSENKINEMRLRKRRQK